MKGGAGWPNGARLAMSLVVNVEEGSEMNPVEGDRVPSPWTARRGPEEAGAELRQQSNYQYGIKAGAPR